MEKESIRKVAKIVEGDYRISRSDAGIKIEVLDYHADPLMLTDDVLRKLGMMLATAMEDTTPESDA